MKKTIPTKNDFSAGGLVWDTKAKKILVVHVENLSGKTVWTFPKGHPEKGESDEEAALREVREETGWDCAVQKFLMDISYFYIHGKIRYHKKVRWYLMEPLKQVGTFMEEEILDCRWMSLREAKDVIVYDSDKALIKKMEAFIL